MRVSGRGTALFLTAMLVLTAGCARSPEAKKARYLERGDRYYKQEKYREAVIEYQNALRIEAANPQALRQLGFAHYQLGQLGQAFRFLLKAQELEPDNTTIGLRLATIYLIGGRLDDAKAAASHVLQQDPKNLEALILWAGAARTPAEIDAAVGQLQARRADFDSQARFHLTLASLLLRKQDSPGAERALHDAVAREPKAAEAHTALGNFYVLSKDMAQAEREFKTAAELAPAGSSARAKLADFYILTGRPAEAQRLLTELTQQAPDFAPGWRLLAQLSFAQGKFDESAKALDVLLKKNPSDLDGRLLRGRLYLVKHDTAQAIQEFQAVLKSEPRLATARYQLALAQIEAGNLQQAKAELKDATTAAPNFVEAIILLAQLNLQSGAVGPAVEDLNRLIAIQPGAIGAYVLLSSAYMAQSQPGRATEVARKLEAAAPNDPRGPYLAGLAMLRQGKRSEARRAFEASLARAPGFLEPLAQLVTLDFADRQPGAAIARIQAQIAAAPRSAAHHDLLGEAYRVRGETKLAEAAFLKAIELEPRLAESYIRLGTLYARSGQFDQALAKLRDATKTDPRNEVALMMTGVMYEQKGDIAKAREAYEQLLAINPRFIPGANNLAWIYSEHGGDKEKALQLAQIAKEGAPDDPRISDTLGWILYKRGIYQRALALLKESAAKLPDNPQVQYHLGMTYAQVGDRVSARKALAFAVGSAAEFEGKDEARRALGDLK
jgi:tetratricopeptide (TPR) repeat protein